MIKIARKVNYQGSKIRGSKENQWKAARGEQLEGGQEFGEI